MTISRIFRNLPAPANSTSHNKSLIAHDDHHTFFIFSQFLMKECSTFCTFDPPVEIICSCYMSSVFNSFNKSICLFRWLIITFFFSIYF